MERSKSTAIVRDICQGRNNCNLFADNTIYGMPCPNIQKYLYVTYFCMARGQVLKHERNSANEIVVRVPSHGHVVGEGITQRRHSIGQNINEHIGYSTTYPAAKISQDATKSVDLKVDDNLATSKTILNNLHEINMEVKSHNFNQKDSTVKSRLPDLEEIRKVLDVKGKFIQSI